MSSSSSKVPVGVTPEIAAYFQQLLAAETAKAREQGRADAEAKRSSMNLEPTRKKEEEPTKQEETVAKLLLKTMKNFTGKDRRPHVLITFLRNFEKYAEYMKLHGHEKGSAFSAMLVDDAAIWYQTLDRVYEWEEFKKEFLHRFRDPQAEQNARVRLHQLRQTTSAKKYTEEFKRLAACISDLTEADRLQTYKHGLKPELRRDASIRKVRTFEEAVREAEELDEINFQERLRAADDKKKTTRTEKVARVAEKLRDRKTPALMDSTTKAAGDEKAKQREELRKKGACFYCKELGHIATACPKKATKN
jgi:hypothetical protein